MCEALADLKRFGVVGADLDSECALGDGVVEGGRMEVCSEAGAPAKADHARFGKDEGGVGAVWVVEFCDAGV
mgnify:CR=1 FL=1